jgi:hypothetical protein
VATRAQVDKSREGNILLAILHPIWIMAISPIWGVLLIGSVVEMTWKDGLFGFMAGPGLTFFTLLGMLQEEVTEATDPLLYKTDMLVAYWVISGMYWAGIVWLIAKVFFIR